MADWIDLRQNVKIPGDIFGPLNTVLGAVDGALDVLRLQLETALLLLNIVRPFLLGVPDPLTAILNAIIDSIIEIFKELESVGVYLSGDWNLITPDMANFRGGYKSYERRMIQRLTDPNDPTRPQIPPSVTTFGAFIYLSVDFSETYILVQLLQQILRLFKIPSLPSENLGQPQNLSVRYGASYLPDFFQDYIEAVVERDVTVQDENREIIPNLDVATLSWEMPKQPSREGLSLPNNPPSGFLVSVSIPRNGIQVLYDRPVANSVKDSEGRQPREGGVVLQNGEDGLPMVLYGGADQLDIDSSFNYNQVMKNLGEVKDGTARIFGTTSKNEEVPIPLDQLKEDDTYYLQRIFYVSLGDILGIPSDDWFSQSANNLLEGSNYILNYPYSLKLNVSDMPKSASFIEKSNGQIEILEEEEETPVYYARIAPVTRQIRSESDFKYVLKEANAHSPGVPLYGYPAKVTIEGEPQDLDVKSVGPWSDPIPLVFPLSGLQQYLTVLSTALAIVVLSRSDLEVSNEEFFIEGKARKLTGLEGFRKLVLEVLRDDPDEYFSGSDQDSQKTDITNFRNSLFSSIMREAKKIYEKSGLRVSLISTVIEQGQPLLEWKWSDSNFTVFPPNILKSVNAETFEFLDKTILQSLQDTRVDAGLVRNPAMAGIFTHGGGPRGIGAAPGFYQNSVGFSSVRNAPGLLVKEKEGTTNHVVYLRNLIPSDIYESASRVLSLAYSKPSQEVQGQWITYRLSELVPGLFTIADEAITWLEGLKRGVKSSVDSLLAYLDFLEARVLELMGLIKRLDALRALSVTFELPGFELLLLSSEGSDGILQDLVNAEGKPDDAESILATEGGPKDILPEGAANKEGIETIEAVQNEQVTISEGILNGDLSVGDLLTIGLEDTDELIASGLNASFGTAINSLNDVLPILETPYKIEESAGILSRASTGVSSEEQSLKRINSEDFIYSGGAVILATSLPPLVLALFSTLLSGGED